MSFRDILSFCSTWVILCPLIIGLALLKSLSSHSKLILLLIICASVPQIMFGVIWKPNLEINLVYNVYTLLEFLILMLFFKKLGIFSNARLMLAFSVITFVIASIVLNVTFGPLKLFWSELVFLSNFIYTGWILYYLYLVVSREDMDFNFRRSETWYLTSYLLYAPSSALVFLFWNHKNEEILILTEIGFVQNFFNIILYLFIIMGFLSDYRRIRNAQR